MLAALGVPARAQAGSGQLQVTAMTYNRSRGSELTDAIAAATLSQLLAAVATDYGQVQATNFPERALAAQAESAGPDLIGVQEAALWQTGPSRPPTRRRLPPSPTAPSSPPGGLCPGVMGRRLLDHRRHRHGGTGSAAVTRGAIVGAGTSGSWPVQ